MKNWIENLKKFQAYVNELGLGGGMLALPAPKTMLLTHEPVEKHLPEAIFNKMIVEDEIVSVTRDLFEGGYYNLAVSEAFKALDIYLKKKVGESELSGSRLVQRIFSVGDPELVWSERKSTSEKDQHRGYSLLFQGGFTGIRNPTAHEFDWITEPNDALDALIFVQHLLKMAKAAQPPA